MGSDTHARRTYKVYRMDCAQRGLATFDIYAPRETATNTDCHDTSDGCWLWFMMCNVRLVSRMHSCWRRHSTGLCGTLLAMASLQRLVHSTILYSKESQHKRGMLCPFGHRTSICFVIHDGVRT